MKIELETVRILSGLEKLGSISAQTAILQEDLKITTDEVNTKAERAEIALKIVTAEADKVAKEKVCLLIYFNQIFIPQFSHLRMMNVGKLKQKKHRLRKYKLPVQRNCTFNHQIFIVAFFFLIERKQNLFSKQQNWHLKISKKDN
jgi:hypothetical protein